MAICFPSFGWFHRSVCPSLPICLGKCWLNRRADLGISPKKYYFVHVVWFVQFTCWLIYLHMIYCNTGPIFVCVAFFRDLLDCIFAWYLYVYCCVTLILICLSILIHYNISTWSGSIGQHFSKAASPRSRIFEDSYHRMTSCMSTWPCVSWKKSVDFAGNSWVFWGGALHLEALDIDVHMPRAIGS